MAVKGSEGRDGTTYRIRRTHDPECGEPRYRGTFEVLDEPAGDLLARCHLTGRAAQAVLEIHASDGSRWTSTPNRRIMPTAWDLAEGERLAFRFDAKVAGKLLNPLYRTSLAVRTPSGADLFSVVDPRTSIPDRILGSGPGDWVLLAGDRPCGRITTLPRPHVRRPGLLGRLGSLLAGSDDGLVSYGEGPLLPAPAALALVAIHRELTDATAD